MLRLGNIFLTPVRRGTTVDEKPSPLTSVSAQFNGSALDRDADLREAGAEFPADLILDIMLQFCVIPHGLALGPRGWTIGFPPECISHCSAAFYLKVRMRTGAKAA